jgi:hypothetical protein
MKAKQIRYPGRKWLKHESLWSEPLLREYLPDTMLFTPKNFIQMIDKYTVLFLKPDLGMKGQGVMKVSREEEDYIIRTAYHTHKYPSKKLAALKLKHLIGDKRYIVQQGIDLIKLEDKPIDFRALMHLKPEGDWRFFGIMGKVAAPNSFVTNHSNGGKAIRLYDALGVSKEEGKEWYLQIKDISLLIASAMKEHFPKIAELGLDIAIDTERKIWLVEANTKPQFQLFRYHSNPRLYGQIAASVRAIRSTSA